MPYGCQLCVRWWGKIRPFPPAFLREILDSLVIFGKSDPFVGPSPRCYAGLKMRPYMFGRRAN